MIIFSLFIIYDYFFLFSLYQPNGPIGHSPKILALPYLLSHPSIYYYCLPSLSLIAFSFTLSANTYLLQNSKSTFFHSYVQLTSLPFILFLFFLFFWDEMIFLKKLIPKKWFLFFWKYFNFIFLHGMYKTTWLKDNLKKA